MGKYESGSKQGWGDCENSWDRILAYKVSEFWIQQRKRTVEEILPLQRHQSLPQILTWITLKVGNYLVLIMVESARSNFLLDELCIFLFTFLLKQLLIFVIRKRVIF